MTREEAIKKLKNLVPKTCKMVDGRLKGGFLNWNSEEGKALEMAIADMEKQIPKKVKKMEYEPLKKVDWNYACPVCGGAVGINQNAFDYTDTEDFCSGCGQALDWS